MGEINVVPYIDVMLVLLIIFMVTAPLLTPGIEVELPKAGARALDDADNTPLVVSVDETGNLYINVGDAEDEPAGADDIVQRTRIVLGESSRDSGAGEGRSTRPVRVRRGRNGAPAARRRRKRRLCHRPVGFLPRSRIADANRRA